jgi:hypothetical protein
MSTTRSWCQRVLDADTIKLLGYMVEPMPG